MYAPIICIKKREIETSAPPDPKSVTELKIPDNYTKTTTGEVF